MFRWLRNALTRESTRKKQNADWAQFQPQPTEPQPKNNLPLDPKGNPWTT